jgi:hypothetical protein
MLETRIIMRQPADPFFIPTAGRLSSFSRSCLYEIFSSAHSLKEPVLNSWVWSKQGLAQGIQIKWLRLAKPTNIFRVVDYIVSGTGMDEDC